MNSTRDILVVGGDERNRLLCGFLQKKGFDVFCANSDEDMKTALENNFSFLILPVPFTKDNKYIYSDNPDFRLNVNEKFICSGRFFTIFGGGFTDEFKSVCSKSGAILNDLLENPEFKEVNGAFTAQGAIRLLLENENRYLKNKKALITGYGKIAVPLSDLLLKLGIEVWVCARNENKLILAENSGCRTFNTDRLEKSCGDFDYFFNTIPFNIFNEETVRTFKPSSLYFELASKPFGAKKEWFVKAKRKYVNGAALPGRYLAYSSAQIICDLITEYITRQVI